MNEDARFEDGAEKPLRLRAETRGDLAVLSTFIQDAIGQTAEIAWMRRQRRFSLLVNRFRWEVKDEAERHGRPFERVQALLVIDGVLRARGSGIDPSDRELVFPILALAFDPDKDGAGTLLWCSPAMARSRSTSSAST